MTRRQQLLLEFLSESPFDACNPPTCPLCCYDVRGLTRPVCPECNHPLTLTVGLEAGRVRLGWLLVALVPGFFSGIAACLLAIPTTAVYFEDGIVVWPFAGGVLFGWCSGLFAMMLAFGRRRGRWGGWRTWFIAQPLSRQRWIVLIIGAIHFIAFLLFFGWVASQI